MRDPESRMNNNGKRHHTRSMAHTKEHLLVIEPDDKLREMSSPSEVEQNQTKAEDEDEHVHGYGTVHQSTEVMRLLQQLMIKQDLILHENTQLKQEIATQQITINELSQAVRSIRGKNVEVEPKLMEPPTPPMSLTSHLTTRTAHEPELKLKEQAVKQLQTKRINQLLDSTPFSGSMSQEVSDWIEEFSTRCDELNFDDTQRLSVAVSLLKGNAKLWYETQKDSIDGWTTFRNKLTTFFQMITGTDHFQLEQKLYNRRRQQNELPMDYCHNMLKLCSKVNKHMDDETRLKHLTKGLDAAAQLHMDLKNPGTVEEFLQALIKHDKWHHEGKIPQSSILAPHHHQYTPRYSHATERQQHHQTASDPKQTTNTNSKGYSGCWTCGGTDHYQHECTKNY